MPHPKGTVLAPGSRSNKVVKPEPPADLWAQIARELEEYRVKRSVPDGAFSCAEFQEKLGMTPAAASRALHDLQKAGKVRKATRVAQTVYYIHVEK